MIFFMSSSWNGQIVSFQTTNGGILTSGPSKSNFWTSSAMWYFYKTDNEHTIDKDGKEWGL